jgi:SAM-dependent methyltransferase
MPTSLLPPATVPVEAEFQPFPMVHRRCWFHAEIEVPVMVRALRLPRRARVLEIGCGGGFALLPFITLLSPSRLVGLDIDRQLLGVASARLAGTSVELIHGDVRDMPFADGEFDVVVDFGTCYHIARAADALREISRVLVPGGVFVTETRLSQLLAHPIRTRGRSLPWSTASLTALRHVGMWQSRRRK